MTHHSATISREELELLIEAYFDCRLSRTEESDLRRILADAPYDSEAIRSARAEMGAEVAFRRARLRARTGAARRRPWLSIAAAAAMLFALGAVSTQLRPSGSTAPSITVYCHGHAVTDPGEAMRIARAEIADSERFMREMVEAERMRAQAAREIAEAKYFSDPDNLLKSASL